MVGDDRQHFERGARQLLLLHGVTAHQEGEIAGGAERPGVADPDQIDAALFVSCLQRAHHGRHVDTVGQTRQQRLLADRLGAGKDDSLRHAHRLGDMQPPRRVVALVALARVVLEQEGNDLCVAAFTHWITSEIAAIAGVLGRLRR